MSQIGELLTTARQAAGLSQGELAERAGTSRPTLSAYECGRKSPTAGTVKRLMDVMGQQLTTQPRVTTVEHTTSRGRTVTTLTALPRLPLSEAFATVVLPLHLNWSTPGRRFNMANRSERSRVYEIVLREGGSEDFRKYIDGALLIDLWPELVIPRATRAAWEPMVEQFTATAA